MSECPLKGVKNSSAALSTLVGLQHLELRPWDARMVNSADQPPSKVFQQLQHLTYLYLCSEGQQLTTDFLKHASCLVNLQTLHIADSTVPLSPSTAPDTSRLTALREATFECASLDPCLLQHCTQLQRLDMWKVAIISADGASALPLLDLISGMQQLRELRLENLEYEWPDDTAAYSGLTASSNLQKLSLHITTFPPGIWQHVFTPASRLPALQEMMLCRADRGPPPPAALGADDISRLISCCPGLRAITIDVQPDATLTHLAHASGLTNLSVLFLSAEDFEALSGLVALQELSVGLARPIAPCKLMCLTALTALTELSIEPAAGAPEDGAADAWDLYLTQPRQCKDPTEWVFAPPVWLQLLQHCGRFNECQPLIVSSMVRQLGEQRQVISVLQEQQLRAEHRLSSVGQEQCSAGHDQQIAALQAQLAEQQYCTSELQEQLAASRVHAAVEAAAAAELHERVQALEGQVQQLLLALQLCAG